MADIQLHRSTFYEMGPYTRADLWLSDNVATDQATQVIAVQLNVTTDPAARNVELKLLALMTARDAINNAIADLERVRSRIR
jgi:translation elongation factor EF-Ts